MKTSYLLLGIVVFLLLIGIAGAAEAPYNITLTSSKEWLVANNTDSATITAHVTNGTGDNVEGQKVQFYVVNSTLGIVTPLAGITRVDGNTSTTFTTKFFKGDAYIFAFLSNFPSINSTVIQKIDHGPPAYMTVGYSDQVQVNSNTTIYVRIFDKNWNPIDSIRDKSTGPNETYQIRFLIQSSPLNNATFYGSWNGQGYSGTTVYSSESSGLFVNDTGLTAIDLKVSNTAGINYILINPLIASIPDRLIPITGSSLESIPAAVDITVNPSRLYQPNDGVSKFSISYRLYDDAGNILNGKNIIVTANRVDPVTGVILENFGQSTVTTTADGPGVYIFPSKVDPMFVRVLAVSQDNTNVTGSSLIEYYQPGPTFLGLTAMPDIMPSKDVATSVNSSIMAKITDQKSVAVSNEAVEFNITPIYYPGVQTETPYIGNVSGTQSLSIITNKDGKAETVFNPGTFNVSGHQLYSANCTLSAKVVGHPEVSKSRILTWKNFPFISVTTSVSNSTNLSINDTIDVTIKIQGEGMEIAYREPMDVVLATSRAKSMMEERPDRMVYTFIAERLFIDKITQSTPYTGSDMIGLLTFGGDPNGIPVPPTKGDFKSSAGIDNTPDDDATYISDNYLGSHVPKKTYDEESTWEVTPTSNYDLIRNAINYTVPYGGDDNRNEEPLRKALYDSINQLRNTTNQNKVIIALVDSQTNDYGNILARGLAVHTTKINEGNRYYAFPGPDGSWGDYDPNQNMATYAKNSGVKIYVVYAPSKINTADRDDFITLAETTGGAYNYTGGDASKLPGIYDWIAETIIKEAAINATMTINMGTIKVNQVDIIQNQTPVFDYVFQEGVSTRIRLLEDTGGTIETVKDETVDQTGDYKDKILTFVVGTVKLHQTWQADYRLRILMEAEEIDIFNGTSVISFENLGSDISYQLQTISISVPSDKTSKQETYDLIIEEFNVTQRENDVLIDWVLNYTKPNKTSQDLYNVTANISYTDRLGMVRQFGATYHGLNGTLSIPKIILPPDEYKRIFKIDADAWLAPHRQEVAVFEGSSMIEVPPTYPTLNYGSSESDSGSLIIK